jgi:general secretion pathway protein K
MRDARRPQRGAAILTAMMIVALVATLSVAMVWQQWRAVQIEAAERARAQSAWILTGALDWARLILAEDGASSTGGAVDHLREPWAVPLAEARLSTFLAADRDNAEDAPEAFLSGRIDDAQARYNLRRVINEDKVARERELSTLRRLCEIVQIDVAVAERIAQALLLADAASKGNVSDAAPLEPQRLSQLRWFGIEPAVVAKLEPLLVLLPLRTPINLNTAPREVIAAVLNVDVGTADRVVQARQRTPINSPDDLTNLLPGIDAPGDRASWKSNYFFVLGRLRVDDRVLEERSLVHRNTRIVQAVQRERISSIADASSALQEQAVSR